MVNTISTSVIGEVGVKPGAAVYILYVNECLNQPITSSPFAAKASHIPLVINRRIPLKELEATVSWWFAVRERGKKEERTKRRREKKGGGEMGVKINREKEGGQTDS